MLGSIKKSSNRSKIHALFNIGWFWFAIIIYSIDIKQYKDGNDILQYRYDRLVYQMETAYMSPQFKVKNPAKFNKQKENLPLRVVMIVE